MSSKQTYSIPQQIWKPTANGQGFLFTNHSIEITCLKLATGAAAGHVTFYDSASASTSNPRWVLDSSTTYDDCQVFANPLYFKNGVYAVVEQGGDLGVEICVAGIPLYT